MIKEERTTSNFSYEELCELERNYLKPQMIPNECSFWMLRTKRGVYYHEFLESGFIAIGWNVLSKRDFDVDSEEQRKAKIELTYPDEKRANGCVNKCSRFIFEMKPGDLVVVVGSGEVAFCIIGEYYEETINDAITKELEANIQIEDSNYKDFSIACPYVKRRKITCLKKVEEDSLTPILYRAISNRHSISTMESYTIEFLSECFDYFSYNGSTYLTCRVTSRDSINIRNLSRFLVYTDEILAGESDFPISTKVNLNSPGSILLSIPMDALDFALEHSLALLTLMTCLFGGEININGFNVKLPSIRTAIKDWREKDHNDRMRTLEEERAKAEIRKINAEALKAEVDAYKALNETDIYTPSLDDSSTNKFQQSIRKLKVSKPDLKVVDFSQYQTVPTIKKTDTAGNAGEKK